MQPIQEGRKQESKSKSRGIGIAYSEGCPLDDELVKPESWPISYFTRYKVHIISCPICKENGIFRKVRVWLRERQDLPPGYPRWTGGEGVRVLLLTTARLRRGHTVAAEIELIRSHSTLGHRCLSEVSSSSGLQQSSVEGKKDTMQITLDTFTAGNILLRFLTSLHTI